MRLKIWLFWQTFVCYEINTTKKQCWTGGGDSVPYCLDGVYVGKSWKTIRSHYRAVNARASDSSSAVPPPSKTDIPSEDGSEEKTSHFS